MPIPRRQSLKLSSGMLAWAGSPISARCQESGPDSADEKITQAYKCLFNHELLIITGKKDNSPEYIGSFIDKLKDTSVDAVLCCPTMWRTNLFPSRIDPQWMRYTPEQHSPKFPSFDRIMRYIHDGGDPVKETLEACRRHGKAFFISYRMNDHHYVGDLHWPTHHAIWREHPEYWLGDSDAPARAGSDNVRLFNYLLPEVRDYYFSILQELCSNYDVDGVELDFQRFPKFFRNSDLEQGRGVMTAFVRRIKSMLEDIGHQRGKRLPLGVRVPETLAKCASAGLDIPEWDRQRLVEMFTISSFYIHSIELGIEEFRAAISRGRIYGEMNYLTYQAPGSAKGSGRRYTTFETYRASALNFFHRGADGLSLFNYDYAPADKRVAMAAGLQHITSLEFLREAPKNYVISPGFGTFPAKNEREFTVVIPDDTRKVPFARAVVRIETRHDCARQQIGVQVNGTALETLDHEGTELFVPLASNPGYPTREKLKFFVLPLDLLVPGTNTFKIRNLDLRQGSCELRSMELALYR